MGKQAARCLETASPERGELGTPRQRAGPPRGAEAVAGGMELVSPPLSGFLGKWMQSQSSPRNVLKRRPFPMVNSKGPPFRIPFVKGVEEKSVGWWLL